MCHAILRKTDFVMVCSVKVHSPTIICINAVTSILILQTLKLFGFVYLVSIDRLITYVMIGGLSMTIRQL